MSKSENSIFNELEEDIKAAYLVKPYPHIIYVAREYFIQQYQVKCSDIWWDL